MKENNKTALVSPTRWLSIIEFLNENIDTIKTGLAESVGPDQIRTDIILKNAVDGEIRLVKHLTMPDGGNDVLLYSLVRPPFTTVEKLLWDIEALSLTDFLMLALRQIRVVSKGGLPFNTIGNS
jgi:hypothetical protein